MPGSASEQDVLKNNVVTQMFVDTADQNYLIARWAYHRGMFIDFFWNAVHALEKYFKASLLLNGRSGKSNSAAKPYGHNLAMLFEEVSSYAGDLFPAKLEQPKQLDGLHWREETPVEFVARLDELGNANNRYNLFGYVQRWEDLHHLDQMVHAVRRIAFKLDTCPFIGSGPFPDSAPKTVRECLERDLGYSPRGATSRLHKLLGTKGDDELRDAGLKLNFLFAPEDYDHDRGGVHIGTSSSESVLYQRIVRRAKNMAASPADRDAADLADWVIENIWLPAPAKAELSGYSEALRRRTP